MKQRYIYFGIFAFVAVLFAGLRTGTGQGYADPVVLPPGGEVGVTTSLRTIEVRLTNRASGRLQLYHWPISAVAGSTVKIECHEWVQVRIFGHQLPGFPKNKFRRTISVDADEEGFEEPYDFIVRWLPRNGLTLRVRTVQSHDPEL